LHSFRGENVTTGEDKLSNCRFDPSNRRGQVSREGNSKLSAVLVEIEHPTVSAQCAILQIVLEIRLTATGQFFMGGFSSDSICIA
jgi:hypothetical protein